MSESSTEPTRSAPAPGPAAVRADGAGRTWQEVVSALNRDTTESAAAAFARAERPGPRAFFLDPLARALATLGGAPRGSRLVPALLAGYRSLVHAAKLWDLERRWRETSGVRFQDGDATVLCAPGWPWTVRRMLHGDLGGEPLAGGRGASRRIASGLGTVIYRECRRGGAVRWLGGLYFGSRPRPFEEYWILLTARRLGLPVPEPVAAIVHRVAPWTYRGAVLTLEIEGAVSLWEHLRDGRGGDGLVRVADALRRIHDAGLRHPDLNLGNVLVAGSGEIVFVDLDRAGLVPGGLAAPDRRAALARLRRSARKLDPAGAVVRDEDLARFEERYRSPA